MRIETTLKFVGPGRRCDRYVIERWFEFGQGEAESFSTRVIGLRARLFAALENHGASVDATGEGCELPGDPMVAFALLLAETTLAIQRLGGHRVSFHSDVQVPEHRQCAVIIEYEHLDTGLQALELALSLIREMDPELVIETPEDADDEPEDEPDGGLSGDFGQRLATFVATARRYVLPGDTQAIIDAARARDIPCVKLDREPYAAPTGEFRVRPNGLLKLGHSAHQLIVDGTFCVDRCSQFAPLRTDRAQLLDWAAANRIPVPDREREFRNLVSVSRARRAAMRLGYPVVVKPALRGQGAGVTTNVGDDAALTAAVARAQEISRNVIVEKQLAGRTHWAVLANQELIAVLSADGQGQASLRDGAVDSSTREMLKGIAGSLDTGLLVVTLVATDLSLPLGMTGGAVVDIDITPELDRLLPASSDLHGRAMADFVRWLFPAGASSRVPIIAITGTNGKTTTSRMSSRILAHAGYQPGLACTNGVYIRDRLTQAGDLSGVRGHYRLFESPEVDFAVVETAAGTLAKHGVSFEWCDVAICLNISPDHIGARDIRSVEDLAVLKRSLLERARDGVVINADDALCLGMLAGLKARRICLVSDGKTGQDLRQLETRADCFCVLTQRENDEWIVIEDGEQTWPVVPVNDIPATHGGTAVHNVSNAMHAISAAYLSGIDPGKIRTGISTFVMDHESTPGRLNIRDDLPFRVVMDYAHNPDGLRQICRFVDKQRVSGRRILMFSVSGANSDETIALCAETVAGHFDHYVCRSYRDTRGREVHEVPELLRLKLVESGVPSGSITTEPDGHRAVGIALGMARPGDLLVLTTGSSEIEPMWQRIQSIPSSGEP